MAFTTHHLQQSCPPAKPGCACWQLPVLTKTNAIFIGTRNGGFGSEKGEGDWREAFSYHSLCAAIERAMFLSTAPAAAVWSCDPASHMCSSTMDVPKRWVACWRWFLVVLSCLFPSGLPCF